MSSVEVSQTLHFLLHLQLSLSPQLPQSQSAWVELLRYKYAEKDWKHWRLKEKQIFVYFSQSTLFITYFFTNVHPSIFCHLSKVGSQCRQAKQHIPGNSDTEGAIHHFLAEITCHVTCKEQRSTSESPKPPPGCTLRSICDNPQKKVFDFLQTQFSLWLYKDQMAHSNGTSTP